MSDFQFARSQMAMSLGFHIIFAAIGIALPLLMVIAEGEATSHFELYLRAMREAGADTSGVDRFVENLRGEMALGAALKKADLPAEMSAFVRHTFDVVEHGQLHEIASAFTYGREDLIPDMFGELVEQLDRDSRAA